MYNLYAFKTIFKTINQYYIQSGRKELPVYFISYCFLAILGLALSNSRQVLKRDYYINQTTNHSFFSYLVPYSNEWLLSNPGQELQDTLTTVFSFFFMYTTYLYPNKLSKTPSLQAAAYLFIISAISEWDKQRVPILEENLPTPSQRKTYLLNTVIMHPITTPIVGFWNLFSSDPKIYKPVATFPGLPTNLINIYRLMDESLFSSLNKIFPSDNILNDINQLYPQVIAEVGHLQSFKDFDSFVKPMFLPSYNHHAPTILIQKGRILPLP